MKAVALVLLIILLSGCITKPPETPSPGAQEGSLGVGDAGNTGLSEMPTGNETDQSLVGQQVDLGSII